MSEPLRLLRVVPLDSKEPVNHVCYHPISEAKLRRGEMFHMDGEPVGPVCLAVDYEYESPLHEICAALGWQGGTIHQVIDEIKRLKKESSPREGGKG
jgi:hypothetical protein